MIPKIIHYCWFGGAAKPQLLQHCINSWKKRLPDYKIKEWNETNFDVNIAPLCQEAYAAKKWAFVADYCRIYALATEGGVYMDTDIIVLRPFDEFLKYSFCSCQEYQPWIFEKEKTGFIDNNGVRLPGVEGHVPGFGVQSGIMMAEAGSPYILDCLHFYNQLHLPKDLSEIIVCRILSQQMEKYGYRYTNERQLLAGNILIESPDTFANMTMLDANSYAWHLYYRSWGGEFSIKQKVRHAFPRLYLLAQLLFHRKCSWQLIKRVLA